MGIKDGLVSVDVAPTLHANPDRFLDIMLHCISLNGAFFNAHRMAQQYVAKAYPVWWASPETAAGTRPVR
jgi:hypothetical protein